MRIPVLLVIVFALVLTAVVSVGLPASALSGRGGCHAANGGVHGQLLADYAQSNNGMGHGQDACGSLAPSL
jgi:hypothetical protein